MRLHTQEAIPDDSRITCFPLARQGPSCPSSSAPSSSSWPTEARTPAISSTHHVIPYHPPLTLHSVFGPRGPFLHSGLSVRPHVTHTCIPPSPSLPAPVAPAARDAAFFFARFFSRAASLSFSFVAGSLGGRPGPAFGRGSCDCACAAKAGEDGGEEEEEDGVGDDEGDGLYNGR